MSNQAGPCGPPVGLISSLLGESVVVVHQGGLRSWGQNRRSWTRFFRGSSRRRRQTAPSRPSWPGPATATTPRSPACWLVEEAAAHQAVTALTTAGLIVAAAGQAAADSVAEDAAAVEAAAEVTAASLAG